MKAKHHHLRRRTLDVVISAVSLAALSPFMALIALLIWIDSKGPIFHSQIRIGLNRRRPHQNRWPPLLRDRRGDISFGRPFTIYKFRSMAPNAETQGAVWCKEGDHRITRMGALLRKTHLDELPQLFNILIGDMSLVGPRPERPSFVSTLAYEVPGYAARLSMKPGLTGLAQIRHRSDLALGDVRKKVRYDRLYMRNAKPWTDLKIILATLPMALGYDPTRT